MEKDERLLPLPNELRLTAPHQQDVPTHYSPVYDEETFNEKHSIREYFIIIYKRLPMILTLAVLVTAATAFYMYRQPSLFQSSMQLRIDPPRPKIQTSININFGNDLNYANTQVRLLQNPELVREAVIRLNLHKDANLLATQSPGLLSSLRSIFSSEKAEQNKESTLPTLTTDSGSENAAAAAGVKLSALTLEEKQRAEQIAGQISLSVDQIERTNLVNVRVQHTYPEVAAKVANMIGVVFIEQDSKRAMEGAEKTLADLTKSIEELQTTIQQQEQDRIAEMQRTGQPLAEKGQELSYSILQQKAKEWLDAESERRRIQQKYEAAVQANQRGEILSVVTDNDVINAAREQQLKLKADLEKRIDEIDKQIKDAEAERAALLVKYTPEYPEVKKIEAKIGNLNQSKETIRVEVSKKIETEGKSLERNAAREIMAGLQAQLRSAQTREAQARQSYDAEARLANQQGQDATRLTTLTQAIETNRTLLNTYTQRQKEQELAISSSRPDNISISSQAAAGAFVGPQRNRNIFIAFLISLAAGIGLAFLLDYLDDSIRSSDDVGRHLGLPTLAMIPHHSLVEKKRGSGLSLAARNGNGSNGAGGGGVPHALITLEDNRSAMAEAYRHLRTSLLFSSAGKPPQTILITSSQPSEGKTTTAINTAITLAQAGVDVVLLDCDLRRPRLHQHFNLPNTTGLTNYLSGERNTENLLKSYPGLPNLKIVTSGPIPPNPAELLSSNEMKNLLQFLRGNFKHVVIDSPPAISFTDAAIMATLVDGVVLVAMAGKSSLHLMRRFKQRLANIGARIYGVVLNGIKPNSLEYGYYGYGYGYASYYEADLDDNSTPRMEETETTHVTKG